MVAEDDERALHESEQATKRLLAPGVRDEVSGDADDVWPAIADPGHGPRRRTVAP